MIKKILFTLTLFGVTSVLSAQISFTDGSSNMNNATLSSGCAMAVADMNNDGYDDIVRLDNASDLEIEFQQSDGSFVLLDVGNFGSGSEWGMTIADVDNNGFKDVIAGGAYNNLKLALANGTGTAYAISNLSAPSIFLQAANFADIDNDGEIDFFGCHDDGISSPYGGDGAGGFTYDLSLINAISTVPSDNSGNYGSIWTDYDSDGDLDLYISKCRLGVSDTGDGRRRNLLFQNDGNNNYTDVAPAAGLLPLAQSWAANFEDIDNDGDFDCVIINHDKTSEIYLNNGNGTFTDITAISGIATELNNSTGAGGIGLGIQLMMEDFDNDGFIDIFLTGRSGVDFLFLNDGDQTFTTVASPFPVGTVAVQSGALGDLNNDGFIDIIAGHATGFNSPSGSNPDDLLINSGNSNNWSKVKLIGVESNSNAIGAKVELYGSWGMQIREVRAGESYGTQNSMMNHFGIGSETTIDQLIVRWPSGKVDLVNNPTMNQLIIITEGDFPCTSSTTWDGTNWSTGVPDMFKTAVFDVNYNTSDVGSGSIDVCNCEISGGIAVTIAAGDFLRSNKDIIVNGNLIVEHEGSVVQTNDDGLATNNGSITVRKLTPVLGPKGFMILGNPMSGETREGVYGGGRRVLNHITGNFIPNGAVGSGLENFVDDNNNNWAVHSGALTDGEGYLVKPQAPGNPPVGGAFTLDYTLGTLNTGDVSYNLLFNGTRLNSPNMLGNPYASAIDIDLFLGANPLLDAVYYWEHITAPVNNFPGFNQLNFNIGDISAYNQGSGGVMAPNGTTVPTQFMASGQGFGVKALGMGLVTFTNAMRVATPNTDYRSPEVSDRQRIWLDLKNETYGLKSNMLVAFTEGATDGFEGLYDSRRFDSSISLYSVLDTEEQLCIQGRTAFNEEQVVDLGFNTMVKELQTYTISIHQIEGEDISNATVYLEDHLLNISTNLSEGNYTFTSEEGQQLNRFKLVFQERVLSNNDVALQNISMLPNPTTGMLLINSPMAGVHQIEVIDVQGRIITSEKDAGTNQFSLDMSRLNTAMYFVKVYTSEGTLTKRIIKK